MAATEFLLSQMSNSEEETLSLASWFAGELKAGDVVALWGDLGAGKTQFVKGIARQLSIPEESVTSPTFTLIHEYEGRLPLYHFDFYRLQQMEEALEIGVEEYFWGDGVCVVEWPEIVTPLLPDTYYNVNIKASGTNKRWIEIQ